jgi:hypothetical protein
MEIALGFALAMRFTTSLIFKLTKVHDPYVKSFSAFENLPRVFSEGPCGASIELRRDLHSHISQCSEKKCSPCCEACVSPGRRSFTSLVTEAHRAKKRVACLTRLRAIAKVSG